MNWYTVGQAHELGLLSDAEVVYLMTLERKHRCGMPALESPFSLSLDDAVQHCRKEYTINKMVYGTAPNDNQAALVEFTMRMLQVAEKMPVAMILPDGQIPEEHVVGDSFQQQYVTIIVPPNMAAHEITSLVGFTPVDVVLRDVQYAKHGPT